MISSEITGHGGQEPLPGEFFNRLLSAWRQKNGVGGASGRRRFFRHHAKILVLIAEKHRKCLSDRHFLHPAFYRAVSRRSFGATAYPPRPPLALAEVACVGKANTSQTLRIRWTALTSAHSRSPITQLLRFIRPGT